MTTSVTIIQAEMKLPIRATDFKARCLALLDDMEKQGEPITITRRGQPIAVLSPAPKNAWQSPADSWSGKAEIVGDIVNTETELFWEAASGR